MKKIIISSIVMVACIVVCAISYESSVGRMEKTINQQSETIADLKNQLDVKSNKKRSNETKLQQDATGLKSDRVEQDNAMIEEFLEKCLTWDSGAEYDAMRAELFETYGLDENSSFAQVFLPINVTTEDGKYNYIDATHANSKYEDMTSYVSGIKTDRYSYVAYVTWSASDLGGNEAEAKCIFLYDITVDGTIENLEAYTLSD